MKGQDLNVSLDELMTFTGLGPRQVRNAVRDGHLPGQIVKGRLILPRGLYDRYLSGEWEPKPQPAVNVTPLIRRKAS